MLGIMKRAHIVCAQEGFFVCEALANRGYRDRGNFVFNFLSTARYMSSFEPGDPLGILDRLQSFEQGGVPDGAGTDTAAGFDLTRVKTLLAAMENPHLRYPVVHVVGTKGKGSVSQMVAGILRESGLCVGVFSSPHLLHMRECIGIHEGSRPGEPVSEESLRVAVHRAMPALEATLESHPGLTQFEALTAIALGHFAAERCDVAVVEAGLGGARDATNVFLAESLTCAVVTDIGPDHLAALGGSIRSIAAAKAGVLRGGRPCVLARQTHEEAVEVVTSKARELGCPVVRAEGAVAVELLGQGIDQVVPDSVPPSVAFQDISVDIHPVEETGLVRPLAVPSVRTRLVGSHQRDNAAAAVAAASAALASLGRPLSADAVSRGLAGAFLPGRLQVLPVASLGPDGVEGGPAKLHVVLDGAHTAESALALARAIRGMFGEGTPVAAVMAMAQDKDHDGTCLGLREMRPLAVMFAGGNGTVGYSGRKAAAPGVLAAAWQRAGIAHRRSGGGRTVCREQVTASIKVGIHQALREVASHGRGVVVVTGSLHAAAEGLRSLPGIAPVPVAKACGHSHH